MNLSLRWLKDYVDLDVSKEPKKFAHALTMSGSKVECYSREAEEVTGVIVGKVLSIESHPDADKLVVCQVDVATEKPLQIVTAATNLVVGALVPVATNGATLPEGVKIKTGKLRGIVSEGMFCSIAELKVTLNDFPYAIEDGIFLIEEDCQIGQDIHDAIGLNDTTVEFEITSNRPDCISVIGLAKETAATYKVPFKAHKPVVKGSGDDIKNYISVDVQNTELCQRYTARVVKNIKIAPSPLWIRERLRASGVRPINNLVDITNFVMLEYGQPLHAFDYSFIGDKKIIVKTASKDEKFTTLDDVERTLSESTLVIADGNKTIAVAGVIGGKNSAILDTTTTVVFESANFKGSSVRLTAKALGIRTDASGLFEKGLDPKQTLDAVNRACELVELLGCGEVVDSIIDIDNSPVEPVTIKFEPEWINKFLGIDISTAEMIKILNLLSFKVENDIIIVPSFRTDVFHKADIAEEVARIYGYDVIPTTDIRGVACGKVTLEQKFEQDIHAILRSLGSYEVYTYSFISPKYYDKISVPENSKLRDCVTIMNPLGEDTSVMRTTTIPSIMEVLSRNYNNRNVSFNCYEIGNEYIKTENQLPEENPQITIGMYGECDFYKLKGMVEVILARLGITDWDIHAETSNETFHTGRCAVITKGDYTIGILGEIHPLVQNNYDIETPAYIAKLDFNALIKTANTVKKYKPLPKYPATTRDLSLICDDMLPIIEVEKAIKGAVGNNLEQVKLFDVYKGAQIAEDKKSVSYSITMRSSTGTLTDVEADAAVKRVLKALEKINVNIR